MLRRTGEQEMFPMVIVTPVEFAVRTRLNDILDYRHIIQPIGAPEAGVLAAETGKGGEGARTCGLGNGGDGDGDGDDDGAGRCGGLL